jgi:hypothetical protein
MFLNFPKPPGMAGWNNFEAFYGLLMRHAIFQSNLTGNNSLVRLTRVINNHRL